MGFQKLTVAQALIKFLDRQYVEFDGVETKFVEGVFGIFGHGNVVGLGEALFDDPGTLNIHQGRNEQGMAHAAAGYAKQNNRRKIIAVTSSIGPGAANMVTAAADATVNNIPLLLLPGDTFATRQPDPVLQQIEQPHSLQITTNDAFKPVCKYWDRVIRPEQLMSAMINAMRVLTDPAEAGAVCIALSQDVEGESYEYPDYFFKKRVHHIKRVAASEDEIAVVASMLKESKKPLVICGGGVRYSEAGQALEKFCEKFNIPFAETQAGKSACRSSSEYNIGGVGVTGNLSANMIADEADLVLGIGTRFTDFTTGSKSQYKNPDVKFVTINVSRFQAYKMDAYPVVADAKKAIIQITEQLEKDGYTSGYTTEIKEAKDAWDAEMKRFAAYRYDDPDFETLIKAQNPGSVDEFAKLAETDITQVAALCLIRDLIPGDAIAVAASGSLPGDMQRMWTTDEKDSYNMEYGYSCMGYEIAAALGAKLAEPSRSVYSFVGDGSFQMMHSEAVTSLQEHAKINILLFDNGGWGCINNLQMTQGIGNFCTEFRYRDTDHSLEGEMMPIDYAKVAEGYGMKGYTVHNLAELKEALLDAEKQEISTLLDIKVLPKTMTDGYRSWWNVGITSNPTKESEAKAYEEMQLHRQTARRY